MKNESIALILIVLLTFLFGKIQILPSRFELNEVLVSLTFALVFTLAIGLEVVDDE
ncbi:MAG: hypothetical protein GOV00_03355 [Candidatus Altiarchaeota archaeon]|nr:hypothetical protein [Candidatus Altiarchaeota archaeon]